MAADDAPYDPVAIMDAVVSHAAETGWFERVQGHEPKNAPGNGLSCAVWVDRMEPLGSASGVDSTTIRVVFMVRIYSSMIQEPQDMVDPNALQAAHAFMTQLCGDLGLGALIKNIDVLGAYGEGLICRAGYIQVSQQMFRVFTITVPTVINDALGQEF